MGADSPLLPPNSARYHEEVAARLRAATTREEAVEILDQIKDELANPWRPMRIFRPRPPVDVEMVVAEGDHSRAIRQAGGTPRAAAWVPPKVTLVTEDEDRRPLRRSAMPWHSASTPVLRAEARSVVAGLPGEFELLPLDCDDAELWLLNATRVLDDVIDEASSDLVRISTGAVVSIRRPAFRDHAIADVPIFRLAQHPRYSIYVDEQWVTALRVLQNVAVDVVWSQRST